MDKACKSLIAAAIRAPSGDNTQPWRFVIHPDASRIAIHLDQTRDPTPMNSGQRMARLAIGAAVENIVRTAESWGWRTQVEVPAPPAVIAVRIIDRGDRVEGLPVDPFVQRRLTNRRPYMRKPIQADIVEDLRDSTVDLPGVNTVWILDEDRLGRLAGLMGRSDALMLGEPSMRHGFLDNLRFDLSPNDEAEEGMSLGTLELSRADRAAVRLLRFTPNWIFSAFGAASKFAKTARRLVESSSGLYIVAENGGTEQDEVVAGRAMQRAWLKLTEYGLAVQPMMSLAILESVLVRGSAELLRSLGKPQAEQLVREFHEIVPHLENAHVAFIARFGYAEPPTCGTGRLPVDANTTIAGGERDATDL